MNMVYVLYEERESSQLCGIRGIWSSREKAVEQLKALIQTNDLYTEDSEINIDEGYSESDPMYTEDAYSNYYIKQMETK